MISIDVLGFGQVGSAVIKKIKQQDLPVQINSVLVKDVEKARETYGTTLTTELTSGGSVDLVIDCLPGIEPSFTYIKQAIDNGSDVITCNKELVSTLGPQLCNYAKERKRTIYFNSIPAAKTPEAINEINITQDNLLDFNPGDLYSFKAADGDITADYILKDVITASKTVATFDADKYKLVSTQAGDLVAIEIEKEIFLVKNALAPEEISYIREVCDSASEEDWGYSYMEELTGQGRHLYGDDEEKVKEYIERNYNPYWADKVVSVGNEPFCDKIRDRIMPFFEGKYDLPHFYEVQRQKPGEGLDEHYDAGYDERLLRAVIFYVNDDFTDGELYFPKLGFEYKPRAGDFITFPSSKEYLHGVKLVGPGPSRYALSGFAWAAGTLDIWAEDH